MYCAPHCAASAGESETNTQTDPRGATGFRPRRGVDGRTQWQDAPGDARTSTRPCPRAGRGLGLGPGGAGVLGPWGAGLGSPRSQCKFLTLRLKNDIPQHPSHVRALASRHKPIAAMGFCSSSFAVNHKFEPRGRKLRSRMLVPGLCVCVCFLFGGGGGARPRATRPTPVWRNCDSETRNQEGCQRSVAGI